MAQDAGQASLAAGARRGRRFVSTATGARQVADVMMRRPNVHGPSATLGELRDFFTDDHVHAALLVDNDELIGVVERADVGAHIGDGTPARSIARLLGRTINPKASASETLEHMQRAQRRRLAVVTDTGKLLGLLCLKAGELGFCSDADVRRRNCVPH